MAASPQLLASEEAKKQAYELILGQGREVFDLSKEKPELRDRYGRHTFGQDCLAARRMVEAGVPYIVINYPGGWDTHSNHFATMRRQCPQLDQGLAMLLQDLHDHGLLESTIVWCCGEFGRGPKVDWQPPWNGGRNHYGNVFTALVAGRRIQGRPHRRRFRCESRRSEGSAGVSGGPARQHLRPERNRRQREAAPSHGRPKHTCSLRPSKARNPAGC